MNLTSKNWPIIVLLCLAVGSLIGLIAAKFFGLWGMVVSLSVSLLVGLIIIVVAFPGSDESDTILMTSEGIGRSLFTRYSWLGSGCGWGVILPGVLLAGALLHALVHHGSPHFQL